MSTRVAAWLVLALGLLIAAAFLFQRSPPTPPRAAPLAQESPPPAPQRHATSRAAASTPAMASSPMDPVVALLDSIWNQLRGVPAGAPDLAELRRRLLSGDPRQTMAAIRAFLASGRDAPTGESFALGESGGLAGAPTLRVLLLDLLGQIAARTGSDEAARVSREILGAKTSADEWAVALRNVGQHDPAATAYLAAKELEMLTYEPWKSAPSGGFLEALDVAVFAGDASFVPAFSEIARTGDPPLRRAVQVALDRLAEANPRAVMEYLNAHPAEFAERPFLRADYFGKADVNDPPQRAALEAYLTRPDVGLAEKNKLIASLAAPASIVSDALLSAPALRPETAANPGAVPMAFRAWMKDGRFADLRPVIEETLRSLGR